MGKKNMSPEEAERLLKKEIRWLGTEEDESREKQRIRDMKTIIKMAGGIENIPDGIRQKVLKIFDED